MPSKPRSDPTSTPKDSLINEWLTWFSVNASIALGDKERAVLFRTWKDGFADVEPGRLKAAFIACLRSHVFKTMPTIGDVRQHLSRAETNASEEEAAERWEIVAYAVKLSPDYPDRNPPCISERTQRAINAAGGLDFIRDCDAEALTWARKRFLESYIRWGELQQDQYLLPDGEIKNLLAEAAQKLLPPSKPVADLARHKLLVK